MKKLLTLLPIIAVVAACSSVPKETYERRAYEDRERQEKLAERAIDQAPKWMAELPNSASAVYQNGTAISGDMSMADTKAKMIAFGKICISAGGQVSQQGKTFIVDGQNATAEQSELAIKTMCPAVDITGVEVKEIKRISEGGRFRSYVLVALPTGDANQLQQRKDRLKLQDRAVVRSDQVFREMDTADRKPE